MTNDRVSYYYEKYRRKLGAYSIAIMSSCDSIPWGTNRDVVADAFTELMNFEGDSEAVILLFLKTKVKNDCLNLIKHYSRRNLIHQNIYNTSEDYTDAQAIKSEVLNAIHLAMQDLPPSRRRICELRYFEGYKTREIAVMLGIAEGTVCAQLKRSIDYLKKVVV